jgi:nucleoside-diphosphate-sugar epimerase
MAINYGRKYFERVLIFRPHNVYGPDMGWEHVVPQLALRLQALSKSQPSGELRFEIQGTGEDTRSFCFIDDLVAGVMVMREKGQHLGIYHVGTTEEIAIADLARQVAAHAGRAIELVAGPTQPGGTPRRCPDISKLSRLGYKPRVTLAQGLPPTLDWYWKHTALAPKS